MGGHTSDRHFLVHREVSKSGDNPKADWYVWADPKPDGSPTEQLVVSLLNGDSAWVWEPKPRGSNYLFHFLRQPAPSSQKLEQSRSGQCDSQAGQVLA